MEREEKLALLEEYKNFLGKTQYEVLKKRFTGKPTSNKEKVALNRLKKRFKDRHKRQKRAIRKVRKEFAMLELIGGIFEWE